MCLREGEAFVYMYIPTHTKLYTHKIHWNESLLSIKNRDLSFVIAPPFSCILVMHCYKPRGFLITEFIFHAPLVTWYLRVKIFAHLCPLIFAIWKCCWSSSTEFILDNSLNFRNYLFQWIHTYMCSLGSLQLTQLQQERASNFCVTANTRGTDRPTLTPISALKQRPSQRTCIRQNKELLNHYL